MRSYSAARWLIIFLNAIGWLALVSATGIGVIVFHRVGLLGAVTTAVSVAVAGLILIAVVLKATAQLDTAENTPRKVDELEQLATALTTDAPRSTAALAPTRREPAPTRELYD